MFIKIFCKIIHQLSYLCLKTNAWITTHFLPKKTKKGNKNNLSIQNAYENKAIKRRMERYVERFQLAYFVMFHLTYTINSI